MNGTKKHCFITVRTYLSVNNMGLELGKYVENKYNHTVVAADSFAAVQADIEEKMVELEEKYPRCRPFRIITSTHCDKYGHTNDDIAVKPDNAYNDNYVFIMDTTVIRNEVEVKGGAL